MLGCLTDEEAVRAGNLLLERRGDVPATPWAMKLAAVVAANGPLALRATKNVALYARD